MATCAVVAWPPDAAMPPPTARERPGPCTGSAKAAGQCADGLRGQPRTLGDPLRRVVAHQRQDSIRVRVGKVRHLHALLRDDGEDHRGGDQCLGPWFDGEPLIGTCPSQRHARLDLDEPRLAPITDTTTFRMIPAVANRRQPGFEKVRAEGDDEIGAGEVVLRDRIAAERHLVRSPHRLVGERLVPEPRAPIAVAIGRPVDPWCPSSGGSRSRRVPPGRCREQPGAARRRHPERRPSWHPRARCAPPRHSWCAAGAGR